MQRHHMVAEVNCNINVKMVCCHLLVLNMKENVLNEKEEEMNKGREWKERRKKIMCIEGETAHEKKGWVKRRMKEIWKRGGQEEEEETKNDEVEGEVGEGKVEGSRKCRGRKGKTERNAGREWREREGDRLYLGRHSQGALRERK